MTTNNLTVVESKFREYVDSQDDIDHLLKLNEQLEKESKRLRKDKEQLHEQLTLIKSFSDSLWDRLKGNAWL